MATDPFSDIGFNQELGQPTFVELITAKRITGQAIRTICDSSSGVEVCDDGPSPSLRLRELAFENAKVVTRNPSGNTFAPSEEILPSAAAAKYPINNSSSQSYKAQAVNHEFRKLLYNPLDTDATTCNISNVKAQIEWNGTPRQPVNIFKAFVKYVVRDHEDPTKIAIIYHQPNNAGHLGTGSCDFWKQEGPGGIATDDFLNSSDILINLVTESEITELSDDNWTWAIPYGGVSQDRLAITFPVPEEDAAGRVATGYTACAVHQDDERFGGPCVVESVEFFLLMNIVGDEDGNTGGCSPDPAQELNIILSYINSDGRQREFAMGVNKNEFYPQDADITGWDTVSGTGYGISGDAARWEVFKFTLDNTAGSGLDQCTEPTEFFAEGDGTLVAPSPIIISEHNFYRDPCTPEIVVTSIQDGSKTDEIQSIVLPSPSSGTYNLTFEYNDISDTTTVPWNANADQLRVKLGNLQSIGATRNVEVSGAGTLDDPFLVQFTDFLGSIDHKLITADGAQLNGTASAVFQTIRDGTLNERQKISNPDNNRQPFRLTFNGATTVSLLWNSSLNDVQSALEGLSTIGVGNISVSGDITDRDASYGGPWYIDFEGVFAGQSVPLLVSSNDEFVITTEWNGGIGVDEVQDLTVTASAGAFNIIFYPPGATDDEYIITGPIVHNASATLIKIRLLEAAVGLLSTDDFTVQSLGTSKWRFTFKGDYSKTDIPQMETLTNTLRGENIIVEEVVKGGGNREKQKLRIKNATAGTFKLKVNVPGVGDVRTAAIDWNTTAENLEDKLIGLAGLQDEDVNVSGNWPTFLIVFHKALGNIDPIIPDVSNLECDNFLLDPVPAPPYDYPIEKPIAESPLPTELPGPIPTDANIFIQTVLERELFDPNIKINGEPATLRHIALLKNVDVDDYNPYLRSCDNSSLTASDYSATIQTKQSFVLVSKDIDSPTERNRILNHLKNHQEILPARFTWDCLEV